MACRYIPHAKEMAAWEDAVARREFTVRDCIRAAGLELIEAQAMVRRWAEERSIRFIRKDATRHNLYAVVEGFTREIVVQGRTREENMWAAMRKLRMFTATDISAHGTTDALPVSRDVALKYLRALVAASFVRVTKEATLSAEARYLMIKATGPRPPEVRRVMVVEDMNTGEITHIKGVAK